MSDIYEQLIEGLPKKSFAQRGRSYQAELAQDYARRQKTLTERGGQLSGHISPSHYKKIKAIDEEIAQKIQDFENGIASPIHKVLGQLVLVFRDVYDVLNEGLSPEEITYQRHYTSAKNLFLCGMEELAKMQSIVSLNQREGLKDHATNVMKAIEALKQMHIHWTLTFSKETFTDDCIDAALRDVERMTNLTKEYS